MFIDLRSLAFSIFRVFRDEEGDEATNQIIQQSDNAAVIAGGGNPFLDVPNVTGATEFKKGYVMRKCCYDSNGKKSTHFFCLHISLIIKIYIISH